MRVKQLISYLKDDVQHEQMIAFVWNKQDVEDILELEITDEEWEYLATIINRKSDWVYNEMHLEVMERYQELKKETSNNG